MRSCNKRLEKMYFAGLHDISQKALELEEKGRKLIRLELGRPSYDSPDFAKEAVKKALDNQQVHYTDTIGIKPLRIAISEREKKRFGLEYDYETEISVTAGAAEALGVIMLTLLNPGEEIIIPSPFFYAYKDQVLIAAAKLIEVPVLMSNDWQLDVDEIEKRITPKTRMLLINSPNNPAGYVLDKENLEAIAKLAIEKDLIVVSDECYDEFNYAGEHISISTLPGMRERTLVIKSASKSFSMTGWRIGYVMGPANMIKYISKVHENFSTCATSFAQWGAVEAFKYGEEFTQNMIKEFKKSGDYLIEELKKIDGLKIAKPKGAFYAFPDISAFGMSETEMVNYILDEAGIVLAPGSDFGTYGKEHVRIAYCRPLVEIMEACDRLKIAFSKL